MAEYDIKQVSRVTDISKDTVHHYVKKFRKYFKGLKRGRFNALVFSDQDINLLIQIRNLNKIENMTIKEISKYFKENGTENVLVDTTTENINNKNEKVEENIKQEAIVQENSNQMDKYALEKLENFENTMAAIRDEYTKLNESNLALTSNTEDIKKMMNALYSKLNSIELRQQKIIDEVNTTFWDRMKTFLLKPVRVPFLWKL